MNRRANQPRPRGLRYDDMRSAMAEEGVVALLYLDSALARECRDLPPEDFSSPLLGEVYRLLREAAGEGRTPSPALL